MKKYKIAIIGGGNMGSAIARGLMAKEYEVTVSTPHPEKLATISQQCTNVTIISDNTEAVTDADIVILAVKPYLITDVTRQITANIDPAHTIIASLAPTIPLKQIAEVVGADAHLAMVIPNIAISVGKSMTFIAPVGLTDDELTLLCKIFKEVGEVAVTDEQHMAAATALCSCGIAYAFRYIRAATEGAVELGIKPSDAMRFEIETLKGACEMLLQTNENPESAIDKVTTPGGITIKGLNAMERYGFTTAVIEGLKSSYK